MVTNVTVDKRRLMIFAALLLGTALTFFLIGGVRAGAPSSEPRPNGSVTPGSAGNCTYGHQISGAKYMICMPNSAWNGKLVVYAHGYMAIYRPIEIPQDQMSLEGSSQTIDQIVNTLNYAFATTSYYTNGLAVLPALSDLRDLVTIFAQEQTTPTTVLLTGVSEGGLITTLAVERYPETFDGGLAMCGPYGDFHGQVNHFGDPRVLFDYFFPGLIPGSPVDIPPGLMADWETDFYSTTILPVLEDPANAVSITQILQVLDLPPYAFDPPTSTLTMERLLWYNIYATNDARAKLGGQPFDNQDRAYRGSHDDAALNAGVARFEPDAAALAEIERYYQTSGDLTVPLVTVHTTGDAVVPYWHAPFYQGKTLSEDNLALHRHFEVDRYGHCSFTSGEVFQAFATLDDMVSNPPAYEPVNRLYMPVIASVP